MRKLFFVIVVSMFIVHTSFAQMGVLTVQSPSPVPNPLIDGVSYDFVLEYDNTSLLGDEWVFQTSTLMLLSGQASFSSLTISGNTIRFSVTPNSDVESLSWTFSASDGTADGWGTYTYSESVVPIALRSFKADKNSNEIIISWETESEINNDFFMLQRSRNGIDFETIKNIDSRASDGGGSTYFIVDRDGLEIESDVIYYRLQQVDLDGRYSLSDRVSVMLQDQFSQVFSIDYINRSNPGELMIQLKSKSNNHAEILVCSLNGSIVKQKSFQVSEGKNMLRFGFGQTLAKGMYIVMVKSNFTVHSKKIIL